MIKSLMVKSFCYVYKNINNKNNNNNNKKKKKKFKHFLNL